jgi:hypothetical protein
MKQSYARLSAVSFYSKCARGFLDEYQSAKAELASLPEPTEPEGDDTYYEKIITRDPIENRRDRAAIATVVFAAMTLEAYVYDYAARRLTDNFVLEHLDRLDIPSKLTLVVRLLTGRVFPTDGDAWFLLKRLIKERNSLIHNKSEDAIPILFDADKYKRRMTSGMDPADAIRTLDAIAAQIQSLDPDEHASFFICARTS